MKKSWLPFLIPIIFVVISLLLLLLMSPWLKIPPNELYKEVTSYSDGNNYYTCSRPVKAKLQRVPSPLGGQEAWEYVPVDKEEAKLFCYSNAAIENKGKIKILQRSEVQTLTGKYAYKDMSVKALEFKYIEDKEFVKRLLPDYKDKQIGCIIIFETPKEKLVYLEDENLNTFEKIDYPVFTQKLNQISEADRELFSKNLQ